MIAAAGPTPLWYAARSTGYVSLLLLTAILVLGIVTSMRWANRDWPRFMSQAVHRNLSLLVLVFLAIHILASTIDPFAGISVLNSVVPFTGSYRPLWLGLGVVSLELLVALTVTSLLRQRISFTAWKSRALGGVRVLAAGPAAHARAPAATSAPGGRSSSASPPSVWC